MRKLSEITAPLLPAAPLGRSYDRRPLPRAFAGFTCMVLYRHQETEKALLVSTDGDPVGAVWCPKAMLGLDGKDRGRFLVATVSKSFAGQKRLDFKRFSPEWCDRLMPEDRDHLIAANEAAKRTRRQMSGHRSSSLTYMGRNEFA